MREIVLDIETTGFDPYKGDRIVEIGCIELQNHIPTENYFHSYINPERDIPTAAFEVHGLSSEFLQDKPLFKEIVSNFLAFISDSPLIIHNAKFDINFLNHHIKELNYPLLSFNRIIDTLQIAREKNPFGQNSLDALCKQFSIDTTKRTKHGAIIDCELLAEVYIELIGGKQTNFELQNLKKRTVQASTTSNSTDVSDHQACHREALNSSSNLIKYGVSRKELADHQALYKQRIKASLWEKLSRELSN